MTRNKKKKAMKLVLHAVTKGERLPPVERPKLATGMQKKFRSLASGSKRGTDHLDPEVLREMVLSALRDPTELPSPPTPSDSAGPKGTKER